MRFAQDPFSFKKPLSRAAPYSGITAKTGEAARWVTTFGYEASDMSEFVWSPLWRAEETAAVGLGETCTEPIYVLSDRFYSQQNTKYNS